MRSNLDISICIRNGTLADVGTYYYVKFNIADSAKAIPSWTGTELFAFAKNYIFLIPDISNRSK